jgi:hypothetical protein
MRTERAINRPLPQAVLTVLGTASAEDEDGKHETQTCPRRHHFSERCKPLRQPPAERSFSSIPPKWNPVRNDRVLPLLYGQFEIIRMLALREIAREIPATRQSD